MSALRRDLDNYLAIRRALGFKLERAGLLLADFVGYLEANRVDTITTDAALAWATLPPNGASGWWAQRLSVVRGFARHLHAIDPAHQVPPPGLLPGRSHRATPFLYSEADIAALMAAAAGFRSPLRVVTFQTLVGLLAVTGLRIGEALRLDRDDVDLTDVGEAISQHRGIDKVSFTGSSAVGKRVATVAGERLAHVFLELGGKSPNIVFPSAATPDRIEATAAGSLLAMRFTRQGQSCTAGSRLFVHEDVYDVFIEVLARHVGALKVGDPLEEETDMGTIISAKQHQQVRAYVEEGKSQPGVRVVLDGSGHVPDGLEGYFQGPTILAGVDNTWRVAQDEIFGPVLVVIPWRDVDDVVAMANDSHYGLAAYVWSADLDEAIGTANRIQSGWVQVNQGGGQLVGQSYGGYKESGIGREFSIEGAIAGFTQTKQINVRLGS